MLLLMVLRDSWRLYHFLRLIWNSKVLPQCAHSDEMHGSRHNVVFGHFTAPLFQSGIRRRHKSCCRPRNEEYGAGGWSSPGGLPSLDIQRFLSCRTISTSMTMAIATKHTNDQLAIEPPRKVQSILVQSPLPLKIIGMARFSGKVSIIP